MVSSISLREISIDHCKSSFLPVPSGVPQGSILGPALFILYLNDLPSSVVHSTMLSFADDTKCFKVIRNAMDVQLFQEDLNNIGIWSDTWKLNFNINKFAHVQFHTSRLPIVESTYNVCDSELPICSSHKDLGMILSSNLSWTDHYNHIIAKAYGKLSLIRRAFNVTMDQENSLHLFD